MAFASYIGRGNDNVFISGLKKADKAQFQVIYNEDETCELKLTSSVTIDIVTFLKTKGFSSEQKTTFGKDYFTDMIQIFPDASSLFIFVKNNFNKPSERGLLIKDVIIKQLCKSIDRTITRAIIKKVTEFLERDNLENSLKAGVRKKIKAVIKIYSE